MRRSLARASVVSTGVIALIFGLTFIPVAVRDPAGLVHAFSRGAALHAPDFTPVFRAPPAIQIHLATIVVALGATAVLMSGVKGARLHRVLGWTWSVAMVVTAVSAMFIRAQVGPNIMGFGFLHIFAVMALISVPRAVMAARRHDVASHAQIISGFVVGGLGVAGSAAFLPGRLVWAIFFG